MRQGSRRNHQRPLQGRGHPSAWTLALIARPSSSPRSNGSTGSTIAGCWNPSATSRRPKPRSATTPGRMSQPWLRDSNETASDQPGPVQGALALPLHIRFDVSFSSNGLMCASPSGPCNDVSGVDASLGKADGDAADFLDRPADPWRCGLVVFEVVFRRFVFGGGVALA